MKDLRKYYDLEQKDRVANITIYGDITSWPWIESDMSAYRLSKQIDGLDVDVINVYINSYGGEVAEGWAIYNALKRHKAKVRTFADGFVCSIASVIFMAGEERSMNSVSALMIHNPWTTARGNAEELRKQADDLDTMGDLSARAYREHVNISDEELDALLDQETWIIPEDAVKMGFATGIAKSPESGGVSQSARETVFNRLTRKETEAPASPPDPEAIAEAVAEQLEKRLSAHGAEPGARQDIPDPGEEKHSNLFNFLCAAGAEGSKK